MTELLGIASAIFAFMLIKYAFSKTKLPWRTMILEYFSIVFIIWFITSVIRFFTSY